VFSRLESRVAYVASQVDWLWASPCPDIYISRAIYCNSVSLLKCHLFISAIACDFCRPQVLTQPENRAVYVAGHVDWLWASPCLDIDISGAIHCNLVFLPKCLIIICSILCDLCRDRKRSQAWRTGLGMWPVMWTSFGLHPVRIFTFLEQYIVILYLCQNVLLSFVLLPVTYVGTPSLHTTGKPGCICGQSRGPALDFTLSGY
jgi:hypothetical protein